MGVTQYEKCAEFWGRYGNRYLDRWVGCAPRRSKEWKPEYMNMRYAHISIGRCVWGECQRNKRNRHDNNIDRPEKLGERK